MKTRSARHTAPRAFRWRAHFLAGALILIAGALVCRAIDLQLFEYSFLSKQGDARFTRIVDIAAHRGTITDRYGEPLAVSTPVDSIWVNPKQVALAADQIPRLAAACQRPGPRAAHQQQSRSRFPLCLASASAGFRGADQGARHSGRLPLARVPALLPGR
jgi:hypothetical protein